jgi:hypothetical protein
MPLWLVLVIGVLVWTPIAFLLACLLGRCLKDCDEPVPVNEVRGSSQVVLSGLLIVGGARRDPGGRT